MDNIYFWIIFNIFVLLMLGLDLFVFHRDAHEVGAVLRAGDADGEDLAHTWLIAIHGDLAVALFLNEGLGGGHDNGPIVRDFLTAVEKIVPSE